MTNGIIVYFNEVRQGSVYFNSYPYDERYHHYYHQFSEPLNLPYNLSSSINFQNVSNESLFRSVCIITPATSIFEPINCGDSKTDQSASVYSFHSSGNQSFMFSLCESTSSVVKYFDIYQRDNDSNLHSFNGANLENECVLLIKSLPVGEYLITMAFHYVWFGDPKSLDYKYQLDMICFDSRNEIKCGDTIDGKLISTSDVNYYYLNAFESTSISFDSCDSDYYTNINLYPLHSDYINLDYLYIQEENEKCDLVIPSFIVDFLRTGEYLFEIKGDDIDNNTLDGIYSVKVKCASPKYYECGDTITGQIWESVQFGKAEHMIRVSHARPIIFDGLILNGQYKANLSVYDLDKTQVIARNLILEAGDFSFFYSSQLLLPLEAGDYILEIDGSNGEYPEHLEYFVKIDCYGDISDNKYIVMRRSIVNTWLDADTECRLRFGTSLANIESIDELKSAKQIALSEFNETNSVNLYIYSLDIELEYFIIQTPGNPRYGEYNLDDAVKSLLYGTVITFPTENTTKIDPWKSHSISTDGILCNGTYTVYIVFA